MEDLYINDQVKIDANELKVTFSRASGPGGQNVNKVNSKVDLKWDLSNSDAISRTAKLRLRNLAGSHLTKAGQIQFVCDENRDQVSNLRACRSRLKNLIIRALRRPKVRRPTKPSRGSIQRRLKNKKANSDKKKLRQNRNFD